jgi:hypothetical protein
MISERENTILQFNELKQKFGDTTLFKEFEKKYSDDIDFLKFLHKHKISYNKKTGWNKFFINTLKTIWIPDKKHYNKKLKKYGYFTNVQTGYQLTQDSHEKKCKWCGKFLTGRQTSSCCDQHKTYLHKVLKRGKDLYGFNLKKNNHILLIPREWEYRITEKGFTEIIHLRESIKFHEVKFSINGKREKYTERLRRF